MIRHLIAVTSILAVLTALSPAHAIGFGKIKIPGTSGSESSASSSSSVDPATAQEAVIQRYREASVLVIRAQGKLSEALGLKKQAADLRAEAEAMASAAVIDKDTIKATTARSADTTARIEERLASGEGVSAEGRDHYVQGLSLYAQGLVATKNMADETSAFGKAAKAEISSASMTEKAKVTSRFSTGMYLVKVLPGFTSQLASGLGQATAFAKSADMPVPDEATDLLAGL